MNSFSGVKGVKGMCMVYWVSGIIGERGPKVYHMR